MGIRIAGFNKKRFLESGNASVCAGALMGLGSFACPCPFCVISSLALLIGGLLEKAGVELWK